MRRQPSGSPDQDTTSKGGDEEHEVCVCVGVNAGVSDDQVAFSLHSHGISLPVEQEEGR